MPNSWPLILVLLLFLPTVSSGADKEICPQIILKEGTLRLNDNEKVLICGSDKGGEGWETIPIPQAQIQIKNIFQSSGYLNPRFEQDGNNLLVWRGPLTKVKALTIIGGGKWVSDKRKRKIVGEALMPAKLDEASGWADRELRTHGFACPLVRAEGHEWDSSIVLTIDPRQRLKVGNISLTGLDGLHPDAVLRYRAFEPGQWYDVRNTLITSNRMLGAGLFQSAYFVAECKTETVDLELRLSVGKPKLFRFGIGASTEEFPFIDFTFKNSRLDDRASSFTATLHLSPLSQRLDLNSELYFFRGYPQMFFGPRAQVKREDERSIEEVSAKMGADLGVNYDRWNVRHSGRFGPTMNYSNTIRGTGPDDVKYLSLDGGFSLTSHEYELYLRNQYEGWTASTQYRGQKRGLGSSINVDSYDIEYKYLWNISRLSPPLLVLGTRLQASIVDADSIGLKDIRTELPKEYRIFYGGDQNLRGFTRQSLNSGGLGYLTAVYAGFELRLVEEIPYGIQPFLLADFARLGNYRFSVGPATFVSQGAGVRWASPFGTLRGSAAKGSIWGSDASTEVVPQEWIYFISFGQEF